MVRDFLRRLAVPQPALHAVARLRALWLFRHGTVGKSTLAAGPIRVDTRGVLTVGEGVFFVSGIVPCSLTVGEGARLSIGARCIFNYGVIVAAKQEVVIGDRCMFGSWVHVADTVEGAPAKPVRLGSGVWVAHGAVICPGVSIGDGAVVSAGSVVTQDVPPRMMAIGNPARITSQTLTRTEKT